MIIVICLALLPAVGFLLKVMLWMRNRQSSAFRQGKSIDAILVLGGDAERERLTANLAACSRATLASAGIMPERFPNRLAFIDTPSAEPFLRSNHGISHLPVLSDQGTPLYISSGHGDVGEVFEAEGVPPWRVKIDTRATDTVTNFTTMVPGLVRQGFLHVLVVTSDYHMERAGHVAQLALEGHGLGCSLCSLPSTNIAGASSESAARRWRDVVRMQLWLLTGVELSFLGRLMHPERFWHVPVNAFNDL